MVIRYEFQGRVTSYRIDGFGTTVLFTKEKAMSKKNKKEKTKPVKPVALTVTNLIDQLHTIRNNNGGDLPVHILDRPEETTATNWINAETSKRTKAWPVLLQTIGCMPETPGESAVHLRLIREKFPVIAGEEDLEENFKEILRVKLSLEDAIHLHKAIEKLYLLPLQCTVKSSGQRCSGAFPGTPHAGQCEACKKAVTQLNDRWTNFKEWESLLLETKRSPEKARSRLF